MTVEAMKLLNIAALTVAGIILASVTWTVGSGFVATKYPFWAWNNGTASMQEKAIPGIVSQIRPGEDIARVIERLGPGSAQGQSATSDRLGYEGQLSFGVRSDANTGIIVKYRDGKVEMLERYR